MNFPTGEKRGLRYNLNGLRPFTSFIQMLLTQARWLGMLALFVLGFVVSMLSFSSFDLSLKDLWLMLVAFNPDSLSQQILYSLRLPRTLGAMLIGANLAVAGVLMQGLTRNILASPSILGITAGAACFMALSSIGVVILASLNSVLVAALGGLLGGGLVMLLGGFFSHSAHPLRLILAGIAMSALLVGITRASVILADDKAYSVIAWLAGSVTTLDWQHFSQLALFSLPALILAFYIAGKMNLLALGEEVATGLGLNIKQVRWFACISIIVLTASSVAIAGPIAFVGLLIPHVARKLVGVEHRALIPCSALLGASLLLWADALSRVIAFPMETPVGVITALIGSPCFILLALRSKLS
jgi:iron complex transport system permease protein